ncbi:hypothetical protein PV04_07810 [Phialophora macrospora]|uniref:Uncharacterized protein n=1 Tax=Phialophora macrospora TaxID=1851006 RepID=A0A0D2FFJ7_9EURO|nr:hypothetical protein PV04_07810 [Phialophora macrospora]
MTTRHQPKPRADSDRRPPYAAASSATPPNPQSVAYPHATSRVSQSAHASDERGSNNADKDKNDQRRHDKDQESDHERPPPRRAPGPNQHDSRGESEEQEARTPRSYHTPTQRDVTGKGREGHADIDERDDVGLSQFASAPTMSRTQHQRDPSYSNYMVTPSSRSRNEPKTAMQYVSGQGQHIYSSDSMPSTTSSMHRRSYDQPRSGIPPPKQHSASGPKYGPPTTTVQFSSYQSSQPRYETTRPSPDS